MPKRYRLTVRDEADAVVAQLAADEFLPAALAAARESKPPGWTVSLVWPDGGLEVWRGGVPMLAPAAS